MLKIAHIINPVKVGKQSDLYIAQPITFETMRRAQKYAQGSVDVELFTTQYPEDKEIIPDYFTQTPDLERSVLDIRQFEKQRKLPLIKDILDRLYRAAPNADYLIYTNVDIALQPYFYTAVLRLIENGYDAFVINRRTITPADTSPDNIETMYGLVGEKHPGRDCFVFKRKLFEQFILHHLCIGAPWIGRALLANMEYSASKFGFFKDLHLTFHIGDDRPWQQQSENEYNLHNASESYKIIRMLQSRKPKQQSDDASDTIQRTKKILSKMSNVTTKTIAQTQKKAFLKRETQKFDLPENLILVVSPPRTGSTWFSDALRCHPAIDYAYSADFFRFCHFVNNRRYPRDLSNAANCTLPIEVNSKGVVDFIPDFSDGKKNSTPVFGLEKIHPDFFSFDVKRFSQHIAQLKEKGIKVHIIYQLRDPKAAIASFLSYKFRNPTWYNHIPANDTVTYFLKSYKAIYDLKKMQDGVVVDYASIKSNLADVLLKIYNNFAVLQTNNNIAAAKLAEKQTNRDKRQENSNAGFLGEKEGVAEENVKDKHAYFWSKNEDKIEALHKTYYKPLSINEDFTSI